MDKESTDKPNPMTFTVNPFEIVFRCKEDGTLTDESADHIDKMIAPAKVDRTVDFMRTRRLTMYFDL